MSSLADKNVYPQTAFLSSNGEVQTASSYFGDCDGMTLRQHFAGLAMQARVAAVYGSSSPTDVAEKAVQYADALIAELERKPSA